MAVLASIVAGVLALPAGARAVVVKDNLYGVKAMSASEAWAAVAAKAAQSVFPRHRPASRQRSARGERCVGTRLVSPSSPCGCHRASSRRLLPRYG